MTHKLWLLILLLVIKETISSEEHVEATRKCGRRIVGYHQSWGEHLLTIAQAKLVTHVVYAFMETLSDGTVRVGSADAENAVGWGTFTVDVANEIEMSTRKLRNLQHIKRDPGANFRTLFAVGGWENSQYFSDIAADPEKRSRFIRTSLALVREYEFDGIDLDWEYPVKGGEVEGKAEDKQNLVTFMSIIRAELTALAGIQERSEPYLLTMAAAAGKWTLDVGYDLPGLIGDDGPVDWINVMTYDYYGAWESQWGSYTGPPSPLYYHCPKGYAGNMNADWTLKYYACRSERPDRIVMGVPFYGRFWLNVGEPIDATVSRHWRRAEPHQGRFLGGFASWGEILELWANIDGMEHDYDSFVGAPWGYDVGRQLFLGYEDPRSVAEKVAYVKRHNLGGLMFWSLDLDDDSLTMLRALTAQDLCNSCTPKKVRDNKRVTYKCSPIKDIRWWSYEEDQLRAGMCGKSAPIYKGYYPICDPEDPGYACCGPHGYCGSDAEFCACDDCVDYWTIPESALDDPKPRLPIKYYTMEAPNGSRGRCGYDAPKINGSVYAQCNGHDPVRPCCSSGGYCGKTAEFCECDGCVNFAKDTDFEYREKQWYEWPDANAGRCGSKAPMLNGKTAICNPRSKDYHCCSSGGYCGNGVEFCECDGCVDFKADPDASFPVALPEIWHSWPSPSAGQCGPNAPKIDGKLAECNPSSTTHHCCSASGYCGTGSEYCNCETCVNYGKSRAKRQTSSSGTFRDIIVGIIKVTSILAKVGSGVFNCAPDAIPVLVEPGEINTGALGGAVRAFEHEQYTGDFVDLSTYVENMPEQWNDRIDSLTCLDQTAACTLVLFKHADFNGLSKMFDREATDLGELHDHVSSLIMARIEITSLCVQLFENDNFGGESIEVCGDTPSMSAWSSKVSSVKLLCSECSVILFDDINYYGSFISTGSTQSLRIGEGWNDRARSVQVRPWEAQFESARLPEIEIFSERNFSGDKKMIGPMSEHLGDWNDKMRSVRCRSIKCSMFAFEDSEFTSLSVYLGNRAPRLDDEIDKEVSSIIALPFEENEICATVYAGNEFTGESRRFCGDVGSLSNFNDNVKSWKLHCKVCNVIVFEHSQFRGRFKAFGEEKNMPSDWHGKISSIQVRPWQLDDYEGVRMPQIKAFEHGDYGGDSKVFESMVNDVGDDWNDRIGSVRCLQAFHCVIIMFEHSDLNGFSRLFANEASDLGELNDKTSSMLAMPIARDNLCVTVYQHTMHEGHSQQFCGDVANLGSQWNDEISSVHVDCDGCSVIMYDDTSYGGKFQALNTTNNIGDFLNDKVTSLQVRPFQLPSEYKGSRGNDEECEDSTEKKAHNVLQWIPFIGTLYEIGSAIGYAAAGCDSVAKDRAIGAAIGLGTDVAVALTAGTAGPFLYAAKTGAKLGMKAGAKAFGVALKASVKTSAKAFGTFATKGLANAAKTTIKAGVGEIRGLVLLPKKLIHGSIKGTGKGIKHLRKYGFKRSLKDLNSALLKAGARTIDDITESVANKIDDLNVNNAGSVVPGARLPGGSVDNGAGAPRLVDGGSGVPPSSRSFEGVELPDRMTVGDLDDMIQVGCSATTRRRRRRQASKKRKRPTEETCRLFRASVRKVDESALTDHKIIFSRINTAGDDVVSVGSYDRVRRPVKEFKPSHTVQAGGRQFLVTNKLLLENLSYYHDLVPEIKYRIPGTNEDFVGKPALRVEMRMGGESRHFTLVDPNLRQGNVRRQIFVHTDKADFPGTSQLVNYEKISAELDRYAVPLREAELKRLQQRRADLILESIEKNADQHTHWEKAVLNDEAGSVMKDSDGNAIKVMPPRVRRAAVELITVTQMQDEVLLKNSLRKPDGRVPGMDKAARQILREIRDGKMAFKQAFATSSAVFTSARKGGTNDARRLLLGLFNDDTDILKLLAEMSDSSVDEVPPGA